MGGVTGRDQFFDPTMIRNASFGSVASVAVPRLGLAAHLRNAQYRALKAVPSSERNAMMLIDFATIETPCAAPPARIAEGMRWASDSTGVPRMYPGTKLDGIGDGDSGTFQPALRRFPRISNENKYASEFSGWYSTVTVPVGLSFRADRKQSTGRFRGCRAASISANFSSASACRALAEATSLSNFTVSPRRISSMDCWTECSLRLFHHALIPNTDSPATPTTTNIPNTSNQTSILDMAPSSAALRASSVSNVSIDDSGEDVLFAVLIVALGKGGLSIPILALLRILDRRRRRRDEIP